MMEKMGVEKVIARLGNKFREGTVVKIHLMISHQPAGLDRATYLHRFRGRISP
jgi:hypothetical protein